MTAECNIAIVQRPIENKVAVTSQRVAVVAGSDLKAMRKLVNLNIGQLNASIRNIRHALQFFAGKPFALMGAVCQSDFDNMRRRLPRRHNFDLRLGVLCADRAAYTVHQLTPPK